MLITESTTRISDKQITLPFGVSLKFNNGRVLHVFDLGIEGVSKKDEVFELRVGDALTLFFTDEALSKHRVLSLIRLDTNSIAKIDE